MIVDLGDQRIVLESVSCQIIMARAHDRKKAVRCVKSL